MRNSIFKRIWIIPAVFFTSIILFLQLMELLGYLNITLVPSPLMVAQSYYFESEIFLRAFFETASSSLIGFSLAVVLGFSLSLIFSSFKILKEAILPFAIFFQTVPVIAIAPLIVIYFGFGLATVIFCSAVVAIFPVLANTLIGLESIPESHNELFKLYKSSKWKKFWYLRLPSAYTSIFAGLKVSAGLSVIGVVAGEFVAGGGLGALIDASRTQQRLDMVYGALILLALIGLILVGALELLNFLFQQWRPLGYRPSHLTKD